MPERKWIVIPSVHSYDPQSLPSRIAKMVTRMVRHCDQDERGLDGAVHWNTICPLLEKAFERKLGRRCTRRLDSLPSARQQQNEIRILLEFSVRIGVHSSNLGTLVKQQFNRNWWIMYWFRTIGENLSITEVLFTIKCLSQSLDTWQEERRVRKEDELFSSRLLIHSEVMHMKRKDQVKIIRDQEKVHCHSYWRNDQNAVYWVELSRAQDLRLQFGETKSNAIIVHQPVPYPCIDRVVGDHGGRIIFQRILTPGPGPKVTLRDTWIPQQQQK